MIGKTLAHYEIVEQIGEGGMGRVYRAHDPRLGRDVAVKVLQHHLTSTPEARARFEREARTVSQLSHPHICTLHDVGRDGDTDYLVMEYLSGRTLADRLEDGPLPVPELLPLAIQTAGALERAHAAGVIHRDLKPGNLMLTDSGVKLLDFGLARPVTSSGGERRTAATPPSPDMPTVDVDADATIASDATIGSAGSSEVTTAGAVLGTYPYMAPEQRAGLEADERSDVFAFGCVLYEMGTAARATEGVDAAALPQPLTDIVDRCLQLEPVDRFGSVTELRDALERVRDWPRREALPELAKIIDTIQALDEGPESWQAWELAREIERIDPGNEELERMRADFTHPLHVESEPAGGLVSIRRYDRPDGWIPMGTTPLEEEHAPRAFLCLRVEHADRVTAHDLWWNHPLMDVLQPAPRYVLHRPGDVPEGMEFVPEGAGEVVMPGLEDLGGETVPAFFVDRHPVTNRRFKEFVDAGGYENESLWTEPFTDGERVLSFQEAVARFTDTVGRAGPAGWEFGEFPPGLADHPVTGVSWFEAGAFAAWAENRLPTVFHWDRVAMPFTASQVVPPANLAGTGTVPVGTTWSVNRFGVHDLAGNVREWVRNEVTPGEQRFILGGGWNDHDYGFADAYAQSPWDRSASNGFRCIRETPGDGKDPLARTISLPFRDYSTESPVGDAEFAFFERFFLYDREPLNATVTSETEETALGHHQGVDVDAAYGGERLTLHVFRPPRKEGPHPVVLLFPGSGALMMNEFDPNEMRRANYLVKAGYAVVFPIYKGTYHRKSAIKADTPRATASYRDHLVMWGKDLCRAVDYVEEREDLDESRIAYYGLSWGGQMGGVMPAIEKRIRAVILYVAGLGFQRPLPEADVINYVSRVTQPTLMLNGEFDFYFPKETSQRPMFEMLGTPDEHKRWKTYPGAHSVPRPVMIREVMAWLERYC